MESFLLWGWVGHIELAYLSTTTDAQSCQATFCVSFFHFMEQGDKNSCAGRSNRKPKSNGASVDIDFTHVREKASGARADRPELLRMHADLQPAK
jgi:hypothetical protein